MRNFLVFVAIIFALYMLLHTAARGIPLSTGSGEHTGYVTAVEQEGIFFKTYRVYVKTDPQSSQEDQYCLRPGQEFMVPTFDDVSKGRRLVTVGYSSWLLNGFANCNGESDFITSLSVGN